MWLTDSVWRAQKPFTGSWTSHSDLMTSNSFKTPITFPSSHTLSIPILVLTQQHLIHIKQHNFIFNTSHRVLIWIHLFVLNKQWETLTESRTKISSEWLSRWKYIKDSQRVRLKWKLCGLLCHIGSLHLTGDEDSDSRELSWRCTSCNKNSMGRNIAYKITNIL